MCDYDKNGEEPVSADNLFNGLYCAADAALRMFNAGHLDDSVCEQLLMALRPRCPETGQKYGVVGECPRCRKIKVCSTGQFYARFERLMPLDRPVPQNPAYRAIFSPNPAADTGTACSEGSSFAPNFNVSPDIMQKVLK